MAKTECSFTLRREGHSLTLREDGSVILRTPSEGFTAQTLNKAQPWGDEAARIAPEGSAPIFRRLIKLAIQAAALVRGES